MRTIDLFSVGHSNHAIQDFLGLLQQHDIEALVDVRRFPSSRTFPQFNQDELSKALQEIRIEYEWIEALGGRRPKAKGFDSPNTGLKNESFRNYADYMLSDEFRAGMNRLIEISEMTRTAIMCAESVFWRCHRKLISDFVLANGGSVQHIFPKGESKQHTLSEGAVAKEGKVSYPGQRMLFE